MFDRSVPLAMLALLASGCVATPGPPGYLQPAEVAQHEAYGAWIELRLDEGGSELSGELIAVGPDTVFVLTGHGLQTTPRATVVAARLGTYESRWGELTIWVAAATLLTASHGWFAFATAPVWIIAGTVATAAASRGPIETVRGNDTQQWQGVSKFARFPQGMPQDVDRASLSLPRAGFRRF